MLAILSIIYVLASTYILDTYILGVHIYQASIHIYIYQASMYTLVVTYILDSCQSVYMQVYIYIVCIRTYTYTCIITYIQAGPCIYILAIMYTQ